MNSGEKAILRQLQKAFKLLSQRYDALHQETLGIQQSLSKIRTWMEQYSSINKANIEGTVLQEQFPDVKGRLMQTISKDIDSCIEELKPIHYKEQELLSTLVKQEKNVIDTYNKYSNMVTVIMASTHNVTMPSIASMMLTFKEIVTELYTVHELRSLHMENINYGSQETVDNLVKAWSINEGTHGQIRDSLLRVQFLQEEEL